MKKNISYFLLIILCLSSCKKHEDKQGLPALNSNISETTKRLLLTDVPSLKTEIGLAIVISVPQKTNLTHENKINLVKEYRFVSLETTEESLIGEINKLSTDSSFIFIFDRNNDAVLQFSDNGRFLRRIGKRGRGPQEYTKLYDMSIDLKNKEICLLDAEGGKLMYYDYSGNFQREEVIYYYYSKIEFVNDKQVLNTAMKFNRRASQIDLHRIVIAQHDQKPLYKGFPYPDKLRDQFHWDSRNPLHRFGKEVFFHYIPSDTIWKIDEKKCCAQYILKFQERDNLFTPSEIQNITDEGYKRKIQNKQHFNGEYLITEDVVYLDIVTPRKTFMPLLFSKSSGHIFYGNIYSSAQSSSLLFWITDGFDFVWKNNTFIKVLQPFDLLRRIKGGDKDRTHLLQPSDRNFIRTLKEEDNPVLMLVTLKDF